MAVNFRSDDWIYIKESLEKKLNNQRDILESVSKSYKEKLIAIGQIQAIKSILNMPQTPILPQKD